MSTDDSEESLLEDALRDDLPPPHAQARVRRRLLAAGIAVGNGMAVTTAAAAGGTPGVVSGFVGKALAMSWGVKLGVLAVVAIPTVGLLVDSEPSAPALSAPAPVSRKAAAVEQGRGREMSSPRAAEPLPVSDERAGADGAVNEAPAVAPPTQRSPTRSPGAVTAELPAGAELTAARAQPSQDSFEQPDEAAAHRASTLAEETRILDSAFAELAAGNTARASALIAEHERRFPVGLLRQERHRANLRLAERLGLGASTADKTDSRGE
ncbi:MAG TPA: hypothetical protein VIW29_02215 [Polyangiaceae bacterium]